MAQGLLGRAIMGLSLSMLSSRRPLTSRGVRRNCLLNPGLLKSGRPVTPNKFELGARVGGPLAVFFLVLFVLAKWMPEPFPVSYRLFLLKFPGGRTVSNLTVHPVDPPQFRDFEIVRNADGIVTGVL